MSREELLLRDLEKYFNESVNINKGEFQHIDNILKDEIFTQKSYTMDEVISAIHEDPNIRFSVRGFKCRPKPQELNSDKVTILSKKMAAILRHGINKSGLELFNGCYVKLEELLKMPTFNEFTREDVFNVVNVTGNGKRRYEIVVEDNEELIGAFQGHSVPVGNTRLEPINLSNGIVTAYHGTFVSNWDSIKKIGLIKMGRNHIHLYTCESKETVRDGAEIIIEIDLKKALEDDLKFYKSKNNVLLCDGEDGILKKEYFKKAWIVATDEIIFDNSANPRQSIMKTGLSYYCPLLVRCIDIITESLHDTFLHLKL